MIKIIIELYNIIKLYNFTGFFFWSKSCHIGRFQYPAFIIKYPKSHDAFGLEIYDSTCPHCLREGSAYLMQNWIENWACRAFWEDWAVMISGPVTQQLQGISPARDPIIGLHRTAQKASWSCVCRCFSDHSLPSRSRWWKETSLIEYAELAKTGWLDDWLGTVSIDYAYMPPPRQYYCAL